MHPRPARAGLGVSDLIKRFREGKPTSRDERQGTGGTNQLWWQVGAPPRQHSSIQTAAVRDPFDPAPYDAAAARLDSPDAYEHDGGLGLLDSVDFGLERHSLQSLLAAARYTRSAHDVDSLLSFPDVLQLHKSLEIEAVSAPSAVPAAPSAADVVATQPSPPAVPVIAPTTERNDETKTEGETIDQMIEDLEVTMTRLNWRLGMMNRSTSDAAPVTQSSSQAVIPDIFCLSDDSDDEQHPAVSSSHASLPPRAEGIASSRSFALTTLDVAPLLPLQRRATSIMLTTSPITNVCIEPSSAALTVSSSILTSDIVVASVSSSGVSASSDAAVPEVVPIPALSVRGVTPTPTDAEWKDLESKQDALAAQVKHSVLPPIPAADVPVPFPHALPHGFPPTRVTPIPSHDAWLPSASATMTTPRVALQHYDAATHAPSPPLQWHVDVSNWQVPLTHMPTAVPMTRIPAVASVPLMPSVAPMPPALSPLHTPSHAPASDAYASRIQALRQLAHGRTVPHAFDSAAVPPAAQLTSSAARAVMSNLQSFQSARQSFLV